MTHFFSQEPATLKLITLVFLVYFTGKRGNTSVRKTGNLSHEDISHILNKNGKLFFLIESFFNTFVGHARGQVVRCLLYNASVLGMNPISHQKFSAIWSIRFESHPWAWLHFNFAVERRGTPIPKEYCSNSFTGYCAVLLLILKQYDFNSVNLQ